MSPLNSLLLSKHLECSRILKAHRSEIYRTFINLSPLKSGRYSLVIGLRNYKLKLKKANDYRTSINDRRHRNNVLFKIWSSMAALKTADIIASASAELNQLYIF